MMDSKDSNPKDSLSINKAPIHLVPATLIAETAMAFCEGGAHYGAHNFRVVGVRASVYYSAAQRHLMKWLNGEDRDPKTGVKHLASVAACVGILLDAELCGKLTDDRPPRAPLSKRIDEMQSEVAHLKELFKDHNPRHYTIADSQPPQPSKAAGTSRNAASAWVTYCILDREAKDDSPEATMPMQQPPDSGEVAQEQPVSLAEQLTLSQPEPEPEPIPEQGVIYLKVEWVGNQLVQWTNSDRAIINGVAYAGDELTKRLQEIRRAL